ncbi:hypothetical protein [Microtetraspora niveoalba]|uniref:hypothetical protein n=1 Tax=Microtetraspora niveoalba TaxID=46175 RepID=UPI00082B54E2|nr:hypothetical protein [Microtetraspora niveoalba]
MTAAALSFYGVSISDIAVFVTYIALGLTLPGVLVIRSFYGGARSLAEEIALGSALGYTLEVLTYIPARAAGMPLLVLAWPAGTYALFLAVPRLRRHWRGPAREGAPLWWSWSIALTIAYLVAWSAAAFYRTNALTWPALGLANVDASFHLSLIGELKHHMPPMSPGVAGEPLLYHWFVHAEMAATSWVTGIEPVVLLLRLSMLPMLAVLVVLVGMIAMRVMNTRVGALLAVVAAIFMAAPNLYLGSNGIFTWGGIQDAAWNSPSQTFGAALFAPVVLLLIDRLEGRSRRREWLLLAVFLAALTGAKATYLPLLAAGLAAVAAVEAVKSRRWPRPSLLALGMTAACLLYAQIVLFHAARQGVSISPFAITAQVWRDLTGRAEAPALTATVGLALLYVMSWIITWSGVLGLLSRPRLLVRPAVVLMIGIGAAGLGAALLLRSLHLNQLYFLRSAYPYMGIAAVYGLVVLVRASRVSLVKVAAATAAGLAAAYLIPVVCGVEIPQRPGQSPTLLYLPYIVLLLLVTGTAIALIARRGGRGFALTLSMIAAIGLPAEAHARALSMARAATGAGPVEAVAAPTEAAVPQGLLAAARWLRDHSQPDDLVATNGHCRWGFADRCDGRHSWVSALTERRVLVEGWTYTEKNWDRLRPGQQPESTDFWDTARIGSNDRAFLSPSQASIRRLRARYGVRWLVADERNADREHGIANYATLRFRSGDFAVYEVPDDPRDSVRRM